MANARASAEDAVTEFACSSHDVDDGIGGLTGVFTAREAVMNIWGQVKFAESVVFHAKFHDNSRPLSETNRKLNLDGVRMWLMYAADNPSRQRRRVMDVEAMVEKWIPIIRGLATAHDKATVDRCEFDSEEHLLPLTSAPVKQLRAFYKALCDRLEADPTIPFFVWRSFRTWGDVILDKLPDGGVKKLRGDLAKRVADMVETQIAPDLNAALVGALQWREPKELEKIANAVEAGAKPRMRGRESCLFLEVDAPDGRTHTVML